MKTKLSLKSMAIIIALALSYQSVAQITAVSGTASNGCTPAAGTAGTNNVSVGCGSGQQSGTHPGSQNTCVGTKAGNSLCTTYADNDNTFVGYNAGFSNGNSVSDDGSASQNTYVGSKSGYSNTLGGWNTCFGYFSGYLNTSGGSNLCIGHSAGYNNTASANCFVGFKAGYNNTSATSNNIMGYQAGYGTTTGGDNHFSGYMAAYSNTTGNSNAIAGSNAGYYNQTGSHNSYYGFKAGYGSSGNSHTGNSFFGSQAGYGTTTGGSNVLVGYQCGYSNAAAAYNVGIGYQALYNNTASSNNALGYQALTANTTGTPNDAFGYQALTANTTGTANIAVGYKALLANTTGNYNAAAGAFALESNQTGSSNTAFGYGALVYNTGSDNTACGLDAGYYNTSGSYNTMIGNSAGNAITTGSYNVCVGKYAGGNNTTGSNNTYIGYNAYANASNYSNSTAIGNGALVTASNFIAVGNTSVTAIKGQVGFTTYSDGRFKTNVTENVKGLAFINKLRPVTYNINTEALDDFIVQSMPDSVKEKHRNGTDFTASKNMIHSGFIAQEVERAAQEVNFASSIVYRPSNNNDPYGITYSEIVVPLVKAVQELSKTVDSLTIALSQAQGMKTNNNMFRNSNEIENTKTESNSIAGVISSLPNTIGASLLQNIPNPFNKETSIKYILPNSVQNASIMIFDLQGKLVKTSPITNFGNGAVTINGNELNAGMFVYSLIADGKIIDTKRMILTE
ncbi:MAG: tail fiber domain-containing protein [Bacteroidia bacterium]|nr:tail fiber domain-containing protein [Bacteroidia bacterium]